MAQESRPVRDGGVVVGFDGSRQAAIAVEWAAAEAARRGARLRVLSAVPTEYVGSASPVGFSGPLVPKPGKGPSEDRLEEARRLVAERLPEEDVDLEAVRRRPTPALLAASEEAELVVVGSRGHGAIASAVLGSVSTAVAEHSACPVVVVRGAVEEVDRPRAVTVGVDGSDKCSTTVAFAAELAARRGVPLRILCAWSMVSLGSRWGYDYITGTTVDDWARPLVETARSAVDHAATQARSAHDDLVVHTQTPQLDAALALEESSRTSDVVVVGARGVGAIERAVLGSVSRELLRHAACPVAVVRH